MLSYIPHIHLMELYGEYYFYDVNTNAIVSIPFETYGYLKAIVSQNTDDYAEVPEKVREGIEFLISQGLLSQKSEELKIQHTEANILENMYENNLSTITLQVTQNCNLRCNYCVYSGSYHNRVHNNKRMSWETAKKALDFFHKHSSNSREISVGFYGGEPLLEFKLIKKSVAYIKELFNGKDVIYTLTTNATLLTEEMILFFSENNFNLVISLDGPKDIQNKNRIFADEHKGTFEIIMQNLNKIRSIDEKFYSKISFNAVIDLNQDFACANDFFMTYDEIKELQVTGNYIDDANRTDRYIVNDQYYVDSQYEIFKVFLYYCTDIFRIYKPKLLNSVVTSLKHDMYERFIVKGQKQKHSSPGGQCLPGIHRLLVNVDGKLYPCERLNESSDVLCIGDIDNGFDIQKAKNILNVSSITAEQCRNCWAFKLCEQCVSLAEEEGELSKTRRLSICNSMRNSQEQKIKNYITLRKYGCNFEKLD
ncbi:Cys-rich peptide radical SAM maturase CcpM [Ruminiclostridium herbifermentans]|uniref:Cys-rich peptide radical SAM maturase CcpM n=1 Tax=Ruminiclostridium herbifermentans TaxID=2488810 RepID=A0A4U7JBU2_9FIRM|nr:Cys-rich peptide radical SAM maturase CcpM [Ruminiclostridium herbifermentans]QNU67994.1 Cys-rich peptide radical SAM maturase CcpM [Ruminiclostridium herbifermentans]